MAEADLCLDSGDHDAGADGDLVKPADIDKVAARLRALLRRPGDQAPMVMSRRRYSRKSLSVTSTSVCNSR